MMNNENAQMLKEKGWLEFRNTGLLWFINSILHLFGWCIAIDIDSATGEFLKAYPARTMFRGFASGDNSDGYVKVSEYLKQNIDEICEEAKQL